jgi:predicted methyltransferase
MARTLFLSLAAVAAIAGSAHAETVPDHIAAALADKARPEADRARDEARRAGELVALSGVKPGDTVVDFVIGGGYFTRILAAAVGSEGKVYAYQPAEFIQFQASYGENLKKVAGEYGNVTPMDASFGALDLPDGLDLVMTVQNYHDMHLKPFPAGTAAKVNAEIFKSLKPGGVFLVVDHEAADGASLEVADSLHRIDKAKARQEIEAAGFVFETESQLLDAPADPKTASVFDPAIRGKTDQFVMVLRKPA